MASIKKEKKAFKRYMKSLGIRVKKVSWYFYKFNNGRTKQWTVIFEPKE